MWKDYSREQNLRQLQEPLDLAIVGGGITGAGVLREAARQGLRCCLLEGRDFAWGTSSWSSKMVHGGLRYLTEGDVRMTLQAVRERNRLQRQAPDMIAPLDFIFAFYQGQARERNLLRLALFVYDLLSTQWRHGTCSPQQVLERVPGLKSADLLRCLHFRDALTDDTRLVLAVLREALADGGAAVSYCPVKEVLQDKRGVHGLRALDRLTGETLDVRARAVVNAAGVWADRICSLAGVHLPLRPLRGSHLVLPRSRLPVPCAVTYLHPEDDRPVFAFPWRSATVAGTTDLDHLSDLDRPAAISEQERRYLLQGLNAVFPSAPLGEGDIISTFSGIRPVVGESRNDPSRESRRHLVRDHNGLISVTGGKLTTFRLLARDALKQAQKYVGPLPGLRRDLPVFAGSQSVSSREAGLPTEEVSRLASVLGSDLPHLLEEADPRELVQAGGINGTTWAELRWSLRHEGVCHLEDLMLRRSRLGLLLPRGGEALLGHVAELCQQELGWDESRIRQESEDYLSLWRRYYSPVPEAET